MPSRFGSPPAQAELVRRGRCGPCSWTGDLAWTAGRIGPSHSIMSCGPWAGPASCGFRARLERTPSRMSRHVCSSAWSMPVTKTTQADAVSDAAS